MAPLRNPLLLVLAGSAVACGSSERREAAEPAPKSEPAPQSNDPDVRMLAHTWIIEEHMLVKGASVTDEDARSFHGRTFVITETGYTTPFHPPCDRASWQKSPRNLNDLVKELLVVGRGATKAAEAGLTSDLIEFRLTCTDRGKPPPVLLWIGGSHAMSCYAGACYVMKRFEE